MAISAGRVIGGGVAGAGLVSIVLPFTAGGLPYSSGLNLGLIFGGGALLAIGLIVMVLAKRKPAVTSQPGDSPAA